MGRLPGSRHRSSNARSVTLLAVVTLLVVVPACAGDDEASAPAPSVQSSPAAGPGVETGAVAPSEPERETRTPSRPSQGAADADADTTAGLGRLEPGSHVGRLTEVRDGLVDGVAVPVVGFDKVDFLTGDEAVQAAREAGYIGPDEDSVPDDYYVRNVNPLVRQLPVAPGSPVLVLDGGSPRLVPGDLTDALAAGGLVRIEVATVDGVSTVTALEGVYVP